MTDLICNKPVELSLGPLMIDVESLVLSDKDINRLLHPMVGSVILFSRNYENKAQLKALCQSIKSLRTPELLICVDHEGGRVQRFRKDFYVLPALNDFAVVYDRSPERAKQLLEYHALIMFKEIQDVGIDLSFTPVLDLMMKESHIIGDRSFHEDADKLTSMANVYIDALHQSGAIAVAKHFPGHGGIVEDSHVTIPVDNRNLDELMVKDLLPYRKLSEKIDAVMTAHVLFPEVNKSLPTFSKFWLNQILRQTVGFKGVIFSDDLAMQSAVESASDKSAESYDKNRPSLYQRVALALNNGCDIAIVCNVPDEVDELLSSPHTYYGLQYFSSLKGGQKLQQCVLNRKKILQESMLDNEHVYFEAKLQLDNLKQIV